MKSSLKAWLVLLCLSVVSFLGHAEIERAQLTSAVQDREPVDDLGELVFGRPATVEKVIYFTHLTNLDQETIVHKWLLNGRTVAEVELSVGSDNWRTYSSKRMAPSMAGNWRVEAWHGETLLSSHDFVYELATQ